MRDQYGSQFTVQLLEDKPFAAFKPVVEKFIPDKDQNKQRAAAELLAGVLGGMTFYVHKYCFSHARDSRFETLADKEAKCIMVLVHTPYEEDLLAEHQDRYFAHLVILYRGTYSCVPNVPLVKIEHHAVVHVLSSGSAKDSTSG